MSDDPQEFWDDVHRRRDPSDPGRPHPALVERLAGTGPGRALELGCGTGANAIWLASRGWEVTAVDVSSVALERAAAHADRAGVGAQIRWECADLRDWATEDSFDLAASFFLHSPFGLDAPAAILGRAVGRLRPGGALLVVGHRTLPPWAWDPDATEGLPSADDLVAALGLRGPGWDLRTAEEIPRAVTGPGGEEATVLDAVVHAVR